MPESCAACRRDAPTRGAPICLPCRRSLQSRLPPAEPACAPAGVRLTRAAFPYEDPIPSLLRAFKYDARLRVGRTLARRFAARWPLFPELDFAHALVPVPLHPRKRRQRGFNQAEILGEAAARTAGIPMLSLLCRSTDDPAQAGLDRRRRKGRLSGAFHVRDGVRLKGANLVLIDDVATTGETLSACARALRDAGAEEIRAYVLAFG